MLRYFQQKYSSLSLSLIIALSFIIRAVAIDWALPLKKANIDESVVIFYTMRYFTGDFNPRVFFDYPALYLYILFIVLSFVFLILLIFGKVSDIDGFIGMFLHRDASIIYAASRLTTVLFGVLTVYLVYKIAKENSFPPLLSSFLVAISPIHVLHSHYATVDVACVAFTLCSFLYFLRFYRDCNLKHIYTASFILGLSAAVKYYPAVFMISYFLLIYMKHKFSNLRLYLYSFFLFFISFLLGNPFAVLNFKAFYLRFIDRFKLIIWGTETTCTHMSFKYIKIIDYISYDLNLYIFLFLIILLAYLMYTRGFLRLLKKYSAFSVIIITYFAFLGTWNIVAPRYVLIFIPFLCMLYAKVIFSFKSKRLYSLIVLLVVSVMSYKTIKIDYILSLKDSRIAAYDWIKNNIPSGSRILRFPFTPEFQRTDPYFVFVDWEESLASQDIGKIYHDFDYLILSTFNVNEPGTPFEKRVLLKYDIIKIWEGIDFAAFHHPRITLYGKKT